MNISAPPLLEVIALTAEDAVAAETGGADRLEVVSAIDQGGLTPALGQFASIRAAVDLPLRVMLRTNDGFQVSESEIEMLMDQIDRLLEAGADQFVFGFLDANGDLDSAALEAVCAATGHHPWTLHHAFDHAADPIAAWEVACRLPKLDFVLSGGVHGDLEQGLAELVRRASWQEKGPMWLAGGGLILNYVEPLRSAGIQCFHIGRAARQGYSWAMPIDVGSVRRWKRALSVEEHGDN